MKIFAPASPLPPSPIPPARTATTWSLGALAAIIVFVATLIAAMYGGITLLAMRWDKTTEGRITVEIPPRLEDGGRSQDKRVETALGILKKTLGVASAQPLTSDTVRALLDPWLDAKETAELPLPVLMDVVVQDDARIDIRDLERRLTDAVPGARIDDHGTMLKDIHRLANALRGLALMVAVLMAGALALASVLVCRASLAIHKPIIELLHIAGAPDDYIATQFRIFALRLVVPGSLAGFGAALLCLLVFIVGARQIELPYVDLVRLSGQSCAFFCLGLLIVPVLASLIAAVTARLAILKALKEMA